jgi:TldD protein
LISKKTVKKILNLLLESGGDFADLFIQSRISNNLRLDDSKIENVSGGYETGCGLRLIYKDSTYYAYIDSVDKDRLIESARVVKSAISNFRKINVLNLEERKNSYRARILQYPNFVDPRKKADYLLSADKAAREVSDKIIQVSSVMNDVEEYEFIANSEGYFCENKSVKTFMAVSVIAVKSGEIRTGYKSYALTRGMEIFKKKKPEDIAREAAAIAVTMLDAVDAPTGTMPVIIGPGFGGVIFHEACGHSLEADAVVKDASVFKNKIGKKIASECVNAIDDATLKHHWGSYKFDGEGYSSGRNLLIKGGVLLSYLTDYKSAKKMGIPLSGNARRQSYRDIPYPRMSNTFIDAGKDKPEDIIKSIDDGIYAKEFSGGQVDPATGDFVFGISEGYIVKKGTLCEPIKGATLIGNGPDILKKIAMVGNNLEFSPGFCGKNGQSIANEVGQPTILVSSITVGGTQIQ